MAAEKGLEAHKLVVKTSAALLPCGLALDRLEIEGSFPHPDQVFCGDTSVCLKCSSPLQFLVLFLEFFVAQYKSYLAVEVVLLRVCVACVAEVLESSGLRPFYFL